MINQDVICSSCDFFLNSFFWGESISVCMNEHILSQCYLLKSVGHSGCDGCEHMNMDPVVIVTVGDSGLCCMCDIF